MLIANLVSLGCPCTGEGVEWLYDRDLEFFFAKWKALS
jgi:hypothetical protein